MPDSVQLTLTCAVCGKPAAVIKLTCGKGNKPRLVITQFLGTTTASVEEEHVDEVWQALIRGNLDALMELDPLWAPCYCPECKQSYCQNHWIVVPRFDEDFPDFYDCAYGTCPKGHERMVDD